MEFSVIQMERFIPVECFRKKGNRRGTRKFFSHLSRCTLAYKIAVDFQNVYRCNQCVFSVVDVLEHNCSPVGEKELSFVVGTCVFLLLS